MSSHTTNSSLRIVNKHRKIPVTEPDAKDVWRRAVEEITDGGWQSEVQYKLMGQVWDRDLFLAIVLQDLICTFNHRWIVCQPIDIGSPWRLKT